MPAVGRQDIRAAGTALERAGTHLYKHLRDARLWVHQAFCCESGSAEQQVPSGYCCQKQVDTFGVPAANAVRLRWARGNAAEFCSSTAPLRGLAITPSTEQNMV